MSNKTSIITTINDLQDTFVSKFLDDGYKCIIVGDKKTNAGSDANIPGVTYIPAECSTFSDLSEALPFNHYCRKNLGYLHAIQGGVKTILDTDDDNFPISNIYDWRSLNQSVASSSDIPNILKHFSTKHIWSRGYPLELVNDDIDTIIHCANEDEINRVGVIQSLVNGDPDVDAIFRLTSREFNRDFTFDDSKCIIMSPGTYSQGNTQSTLWINPVIFHLLYIPVTVSFRFCDILKMYVAQRCMWEYGLNFAVTSPFFNQSRNAHDYMKDLESETSMYNCLLRLLRDILPNVKLRGDVDDLVRVYECLYKNGIVTSQEIDTVKLYIKCIS